MTGESDSAAPSGVRKFVLCGSVRAYRSVVGSGSEYENSQNLENKPLGKLFITHTHPSHSKASLFIQFPTDFIGTRLLDIEQLDSDNFIIQLPDSFTLKPIMQLNADELAKSQKPEPSLELNAHLYLRCDSCKKRSLYKLKELTNTIHCANCNKDLTIYHWTGRCGPDNTFKISDITDAYIKRYLFTKGFIQRKVNLYVKDALGVMCYVDFRGKKIPNFYAFGDKGGLANDKLPDILKCARKEIVPYLERPTSADLGSKYARQEQIAKTNSAPDPLEMQATIDELTQKGVNVLAHLKELNEKFIPNTTTYSIEYKELNNNDSIIKPKCPECGSEQISVVENSMGKAERCSVCNYLKIIGGDENEYKRNECGTETAQKIDDNRDEKRKGSVDESFF